MERPRESVLLAVRKRGQAMNQLPQMRCTACRGGAPPLTGVEIAQVGPQVLLWNRIYVEIWGIDGMHGELQTFPDRQLNRDLRAVCERGARVQLRLPDGQHLSFTIGRLCQPSGPPLHWSARPPGVPPVFPAPSASGPEDWDCSQTLLVVCRSALLCWRIVAFLMHTVDGGVTPS